jgi:hypothetical protein
MTSVTYCIWVDSESRRRHSRESRTPGGDHGRQISRYEHQHIG